MELKFLGRGSAFNTKEGNTSAYIKENDTLFLIDCGSNVFERIMQRNLLDGIKNVYVAITHRHSDHIGSLGDLIFYCYYKLNIQVKLYYSDTEIEEYLFLNGVMGDKYDIFFKYIPQLGISIKNKSVSHVGIFKDAYDNLSESKYDSYHSKNIFECNGYVIKTKDEKIFYSGDCNWLDWWNFRYCNKFYIDCCFANYSNNVHYNIENMYEDCNNNNIDIQKVYCMHFDCDKAINRAKELGFNIVEVK